jgi:hypothetical protein
LKTGVGGNPPLLAGDRIVDLAQQNARLGNSEPRPGYGDRYSKYEYRSWPGVPSRAMSRLWPAQRTSRTTRRGRSQSAPLISRPGQSPPSGPATTVLSAPGEPVPHVITDFGRFCRWPGMSTARHREPIHITHSRRMTSIQSVRYNGPSWIVSSRDAVGELTAAPGRTGSSQAAADLSEDHQSR